MTAPAIDRVLDEAIASDTAPGIVALAADEGGVIYQGARGRTGPGAETPVALDSVFRIASMTKAITSAAAMKLVEQGKLGLEQPMAEIAPELAEAVILLGFDADGTPRTRKPLVCSLPVHWLVTLVRPARGFSKPPYGMVRGSATGAEFRSPAMIASTGVPIQPSCPAISTCTHWLSGLRARISVV